MWKELNGLVAARPAMIANLDKVRATLERFGRRPRCRKTDPVSGEVVLSLGGEGGKGAKQSRQGR